MSLIILNVDEVRRTLSASGGAFVVHDKEVDIVRFAINSGFADIVLDGQVALRVMYQRPGETEVRAQTLTYHDTDGLRNYYDWQLLSADLAEKGALTVALCILRTDSEVEEWHTTPCQIRVLNTIHTDDSDEADETITPTVAQRVAVLEAMVQRVASGAPIVVTSTSAMTDTNQIYVLSTNRQWYYHDGSAWVAGGEYGAVATDTTLTQSGMAADAEAVGNALNEIRRKQPWDLSAINILSEIGSCLLFSTSDGGGKWSALIDRLIQKFDPSTYTVSISAGHCTISNPTTTVYESMSYSCIFTPNTGYSITSISAVMGSASLEPINNHDGSYTISTQSVTGNITINVVAEGAIAPTIFSVKNTTLDGTQTPTNTGLLFGSSDANGVMHGWTIVLDCLPAKVNAYLFLFGTGADTCHIHFIPDNAGNSLFRALSRNLTMPTFRTVGGKIVIVHEEGVTNTLKVYNVESGAVVEHVVTNSAATTWLDKERSGTVLYFGSAIATNSDMAFQGTVNEFTIYDAVLSASDIESYLL